MSLGFGFWVLGGRSRLAAQLVRTQQFSVFGFSPLQTRAAPAVGEDVTSQIATDVSRHFLLHCARFMGATSPRDGHGEAGVLINAKETPYG